MELIRTKATNNASARAKAIGAGIRPLIRRKRAAAMSAITTNKNVAFIARVILFASLLVVY